MKTIVEINGTNYSSTGNIALNIAKQARLEGFEVFTSCKLNRRTVTLDYPNQIYIGTRLERVISEQLGSLTGYEGSFNIFGTYKFLKQLDQIKPDLVHLHIMHQTYINLSMLFKYLKKHNIPVVYTFHDCWAFTGKCPYFEKVNCYKWKEECGNCPLVKTYPESYFLDKTRYLLKKKKKLIGELNNLTIVTPSKWLKDYVEQSFLKRHKSMVIYNGINLEIFKPWESNFKEKYNITDKKVILGVGFNWTPRKGLDDFIELSKRLPDNYQIVIVGTNDNVDKKLPKNIISIHRTYDQKELAEIYSVADLFVNPTMEDNFPTVNIESLACGCPVLTYRTGGSPESLDATCGSVVEKGNIDSLEKEIIRILENNPYSREDCVKRAQQFDMNNKFKEYVKLFKEILD